MAAAILLGVEASKQIHSESAVSNVNGFAARSRCAMISITITCVENGTSSFVSA